MENGPFEDVFPIKNRDIPGYSIAMLVYQRVLNEKTAHVLVCVFVDPGRCYVVYVYPGVPKTSAVNSLSKSPLFL